MGKDCYEVDHPKKKKYWNTYIVQIAKIINIFRFSIDFLYDFMSILDKFDISILDNLIFL